MDSTFRRLVLCIVIGINAIQLRAADALDSKQKCIVTISAFTANGNLTELKTAIHEGLDAGLTVSEIKEVIVQLYAYAGFPRSLNALHAFMDVLKDRKKNGINDAPGKAASPYPSNKTKLEFGTENQTRLVGTPVKGEVYEFAPAIDEFLKTHLFGDIFGRDILDWKTREIATISALACLAGAQPQLRSHFNVGLHNGLTNAQLINIVSIIQSRVGSKEGEEADSVLQLILNPGKESVKVANGASESSVEKDLLFKKGERITGTNFHGSAWLNPLVDSDSATKAQVGNVTFAPGARTNWHYHPGGQILMVTSGTGYYQEKGNKKRIIRKGDVVKCPPNLPHWHGASADDEFIQVAITLTQNGPTVWLAPVSDAEYKGN